MLIARSPLRRGALLLGLAVGVPLAGLFLMLEPVVALPLVVAAFVILAFEAPVAAVGMFLFAHIATPAYLRAPIPGGVYAPPISTTLLLALIGIGVLAYLARVPLPRRPAHGARRLVAAFAVFAAIAASSLIDARTGGEALGMWTKVFVLPAAALVAILCACRGPRDVERLVLFVTAGGVVAAVYAVLEYGLGRNPLLEMYRSEIDVRYFTSDVLGEIAYRCFSVYGNPLEFAMVMGMIFPFAAVRVATAATLREKLAYGIVAAILALGVALTFSRGPMLALIAGCLLTGIIYRQLRPWIAGAAVLAMAALIVAWPFIGAGISNRINDVDNMTLRLKLWEIAFSIFSDHPLRGVGIGNFPAYYLEAARENHIGPFYEFGQDALARIRVAENTYLQLLAETGVIGVAAGFAMIIVMLGLCVHHARRARNPRSRDLATAIALSIVIYACNGLFVTAYTFYFGTLLLLGFLPGCLLVIDRAEATEGGAPDARTATG